MPFFELEYQPATIKLPDGRMATIPPSRALIERGATIWVQIRPHRVIVEALRKSGKQLPPVKEGWATIDTGATISAVDYAICNELGFPEVGISKVFHAGEGGPTDTPCFSAAINLMFSPGKPGPTFEFRRVAGIDLATGSQGEAPIALLGRDFLADKKFTYNGMSGRIELAF